MAIFGWISVMGTRLIALAVVIGLFTPQLAEILRPHLGNFVITMLTVSLLRVDYGAFLARLRRPMPAVVGAAWITIVLPIAVLASALALGVSSPVILIILFIFFAPPPVVSAPAFAMLMGLDGALVLTVMLIATVMMPLTAAGLAALFVPDLPLEASALALRLAFMITLAFVMAGVLRRVLGEARITAAKPVLDTLSVAIAILFAIGAMDGVGARLVEDPAFVLAAAGGAFLVMLAQIALTYGLFRPFIGPDAVAVAYAAGNRNAGLLLAAVGIQAVNDTVWLFFALSQLPIFLFPLLLKPLGRRLSARTSAAAPASGVGTGTPPP